VTKIDFTPPDAVANALFVTEKACFMLLQKASKSQNGFKISIAT